MKLTGIDIKEFRGFDSLTVDDFGQLNVIVGRNNVGKTAFLEAVALSVASTEPQAALSLNQVREISEYNIDSFRGFFYNLSFDNSPCIKSTWESESGTIVNRTVQFDAKINLSYLLNNSGNNHSGSIVLTPSDSHINQIDILTEREKNVKTKVSIFFSDNGNNVLNVEGKKDLTEALVFLPSTTTQEPILQRVSYLKENKLDEPLLGLLKKIDGKVRALEVIGDKLLLNIEGASKLMPLGLMGDGIKKVMSIMASITDTDSSTIVLIDEIENGLHYSLHKELWRAIIYIIQETKTQMFVTTHNSETLHYLESILDEEINFQSSIRVFDITKTKLRGFQAYKYTYEGLSGAIENGIEIRR